MPKYLDTNGLRTLWAQITNKIGQESSATEEALDAKLDSLKKDLITIVEKEGSIISIETISGLSIRPTSYIKSAQSGSGWDEVNVIRTGKNLAAITDKDTTSSGVTIGIKDGIVTMNGTSTSNSGTVSLWKTVLKPGKYTLSHNVLAGEMVNAPENASVLNVGSSRTRLNAPTLTFTVNEEAEYNFSIVRASSAVTYDNFTFSVQLECGETATEFETPKTQILTATLPETVYGGTLDWGTGVLTSTLDADGNELAQPKVFQLEPQQLSTIDGVNFVWSNCGDTKAIFNLTPTTSDSDKADKKQGVYYIEGTGTTAGTWVGSHEDIKEYYPGLNILYKIPVAGASTTKLNINDLGAVPVVKNVNTAVSTSYAAKSIVNLIYTLDGETAYWKTADYDTNTKNSAGTSNKVDTKLFLVGGGAQNSSGVTTYSNVGTYIGTDNYLYSNNSKVATEVFVTNKIAEAELSGGDVDLSGYATKDELNAAVGNINYPVDSVNGKTGAVTLSADDVNALPLTGGTITGNLTISNSNNYSYLYLANQSGKNIGGLYASDSENRLYLINHAPNSTAGKYEGYGLPAATTDNLTDHKWYKILTSKETVTVAQGGTGADNERDAIENLGLRVAPYLGVDDYADITDLNNLTLTGLFQVAGNFTNAPLTNPCFILSVKASNDRITQFGWRSNVTTASKNIYMRRQGDTVGTWDDWEIIAGPGLVSGYLPLSGGTLTGGLTVNSEFYVQRSNNYPSVYFNDKNGNMVGMMQFSAANHRGYFVEYATDTSYRETYNLPLVATGLTADKSYSILTSKSPVTIEQGGTGATTAEAARTALGITDNKVTQTLTEDVSKNTNWYLLASNSQSTGTRGAVFTKDLRIQSYAGTTSATGEVEMIIGNSTASGTAGNKEGFITLYSQGSSYHMIKTASVSSGITHTLPAKSGTILNTGTFVASATAPSSPITGMFWVDIS